MAESPAREEPPGVLLFSQVGQWAHLPSMTSCPSAAAALQRKAPVHHLRRLGCRVATKTYGHPKLYLVDLNFHVSDGGAPRTFTTHVLAAHMPSLQSVRTIALPELQKRLPVCPLGTSWRREQTHTRTNHQSSSGCVVSGPLPRQHQFAGMGIENNGATPPT